MKKVLFILLVALGIVAYMSSMSYEQQTIVPELRQLLKTEPFKDTLSYIEIPYWGDTISVETRGYVYFVEFLIRKATHFIGYGIVGIILWILYLKLKWRFPSLLAIFTIVIIASADELRQLFMPGRTGVFDDVKLDVTGAIVFIGIVNLIRIIKARHSKTN